MSRPLVRLQHAQVEGRGGGGQQATITVDFSFLCKAVPVFLSYRNLILCHFFMICFFIFDLPFLPLAPFLVSVLSLILAF